MGIVCVTPGLGLEHVRGLMPCMRQVRGTVRSTTSPKCDVLRELPGAAERLELVEADLMVEGSFDAAVRGCVGVFHTASPFHLRADKPSDFLEPAVQGTRNVYSACLREGGSTLRRVVTTSSFASLILGSRDQPNLDHSRPYTEDDWNEHSTADAPDSMSWYRLSKTEAERVAWSFLEEHTPSWDIITINPPLVLGPWLPHFNTLHGSAEVLLGLLDGSAASQPMRKGGMAFVDVRDVARAHILALEAHPAGKNRYLVAGRSATWAELCTRLARLAPDLAAQLPHQPATDEEALVPPYAPVLVTDKARRDLSMTEYLDLDESLAAQIHALRSHGYLPAEPSSDTLASL